MATVQAEAEKAHAYTSDYTEKYPDEPHVLEGFSVDPKVERRILRKGPPSKFTALMCRLTFD